MKKTNALVQPETIGAFDAKTHLSRLLRETRAGKSFIITQRGKAVAELRPIEPAPVRGKWGDMKGKIWVADDFCDPIEDMKEYME
jgi:prevent-host-death family protein